MYFHKNSRAFHEDGWEGLVSATLFDFRLQTSGATIGLCNNEWNISNKESDYFLKFEKRG
jgi:hypothetical protein